MRKPEEWAKLQGIVIIDSDGGAWDKFCELHGVSVWAINEGGEDCQVSLNIHQAHHLGIIELSMWKRKAFDEVYKT